MALREYLGSARRALAYSLVSTLMLAVLGVARWATEVFLEGLTQERGVVRDAGIVLAVVLAFAALQPCVIRYVTRICFARWHQAGEQFRAFVDHAAHIQDAESMKRHFIDSVDALTCGQGSALYVADAEGDLRLARSTFVAAPACLRADAFRARELARGARCVRLCGIDDGVPGPGSFRWYREAA